MKNDFSSLPKPFIYLITEGRATERNFSETSAQILDLVKIAVDAKISLIQLREKNLSARSLFKLSLEAARVASGSATKILVNDRADIALAAAADGVHLTGNSLPAEIIRRRFPKDFIIGASAHTAAELETRKTGGADFAVFGPVFSTPGKGEPHGLDRLREICRRLEPFPIVALGGIDRTNFKSVLESGASGLAAIRFLNEADNLRKLTAEIKNG